jgi:hypothetical protein
MDMYLIRDTFSKKLGWFIFDKHEVLASSALRSDSDRSNIYRRPAPDGKMVTKCRQQQSKSSRFQTRRPTIKGAVAALDDGRH